MPLPEALEAILLGRSSIEPTIAVLKPLSSAISIGTGGPFGEEGPIIMTGGACGSIFAQLVCRRTPPRSTGQNAQARHRSVARRQPRTS